MEPDRLPPEALLPDAPIFQLLSLKHNPLVKDMSNEQLLDFITKLKALAVSSPTLSAKLNSDSEKIKQKRQPSKKQALLDSI